MAKKATPESKVEGIKQLIREENLPKGVVVDLLAIVLDILSNPEQEEDLKLLTATMRKHNNAEGTGGAEWYLEQMKSFYKGKGII